MANKTYTTLSLEAVKLLTGLIRDTVSVGEAIDDLHIRSDGSWSSVKIDTLIKQCLQDSNDYTDRLVANLSRLELKIATSESEITQPNIMYLYKPSGATSYEQYVVIEGTKVLLGTCDIDMGDYYTITQTDAKFTLLTDFNDLKTAHDTHIADSVAHLTQEERDKMLTTDDIATSISNAPSDDKVVSEKAVYDKYSLHDLSEANTNVINDAILVDTQNQYGSVNKDCLVTSSSSNIPDGLLWGIRQVFWHADSDLVLKITGKDINNKACIWINSLMLKDGRYHWLGWSKNVTSSSSEGANKLLTIKQANACTFSGETITSNSGDSGGGCVFTAPLGVKTVAFDLISDGIFCQCGLCNMSGTLPTIITAGNNRTEFKNISTSGTYYIENIKVGSNIYIGGSNGVQISNIRITEWY